MNRINIVVKIINSYGGGSIVACTTKDKKILDRCDNLPEFAFSKANSEIFYCLSSKESGLIIQQIRRTYGGRSGSYNVFSLVIPLKYIISSSIIYIFDKVNEIYQKFEGENRNNKLEELAEAIKLKEYPDSDLFAINNKVAYRVFDEELLYNPMQPRYKEFEYILLVDNNDKICFSSEYEIKGDIIEKKQVYSVSRQVVGGVEFFPEEDCFVCYESELDSKYVTYKADGYVDISKKYGDAITTNDIFIKIPKNSIKIIPSGAEITCEIAKSDDGDFIIIRYDKCQGAVFVITKKDYYPNQMKFEEWKRGEKITLEKKEQEKGRKKILKRLVLFVVLLMVCGGGLKIYDCYSNPTSDKGVVNPVTDEEENKESERDSTKVKVEEFLASENWHDTDIAELNGLYLAMNTFSYKDIKKKHDTYKARGYNVGKLDTVIGIIQEYGDNINKPKANYSVLTGDSIINIGKWIEIVKNENETLNPLTNGGAATSYTSKEYKCKWCEKTFDSEGQKNKHEEFCPHNPNQN